MKFEYVKRGGGMVELKYTGGTHAFMEAQEKNVWVLPSFIFSCIGSMIMSLYTECGGRMVS